MPPKKGSTTKAKSQDLAQLKKDSSPPPVTPSLQRIPSKYLGIYNDYFRKVPNLKPGIDGPEAFLRKVGALQKHRIHRYRLKLQFNVNWEKELRILRKFKNLRSISLETESDPYFLKRCRTFPTCDEPRIFKEIVHRFPRLLKLELTYPNKVKHINNFRRLRSLDHITLGLKFANFQKEKHQEALVQLFSRDFRHQRFNSAKLICYGDGPRTQKKTKKASKGKPKGKAKATKKKGPELKPLEYLNPQFSHLTKLQKLFLDFKENKSFTAFLPLVAAEVFPQLKLLSVQVLEKKFSIENKTENVVDQAISLIELLIGKALKKDVGKKNIATTSMPEIKIQGYENTLKYEAQELAALGKVVSLAIKISKTQEKEFSEMFSHLKDLKSLSFQYSPTADWQILEVCEGIRNITELTELELYFKNYTFSKESVQEVHNSILKHSSSLKKFSFGFQDVETLNDTKSVMDLVLQLQNVSMLRLYIGASSKKHLPPLRNLIQLKRLIELEIGAFFNTQKVGDITKEFIEITAPLRHLRYLCLKPVWKQTGYEVGEHYMFGVDYDDTRKMLCKKLRSIEYDFQNETWLKMKPEPKEKPYYRYYD